MKIIILGAGQVGSSVASNLCGEANDITIVDQNPNCLNALKDRLDLRTVVGHASHPQVLGRAGATDADMVIAVTNSDETNMVACQIAYTLFHTPDEDRPGTGESIPESSGAICAGGATDRRADQPGAGSHALHQTTLIEFPGALQVVDFADGKVQLVAARAFYGGPLVGQRLRELRQQLPGVETRVTAIFRRHETIIPRGRHRDRGRRRGPLHRFAQTHARGDE